MDPLGREFGSLSSLVCDLEGGVGDPDRPFPLASQVRCPVVMDEPEEDQREAPSGSAIQNSNQQYVAF